MAVTINASTSTGLVNTADTSGIIKLQSNGVTTNALAWVSYKGTATRSIYSQYNVSSVTFNSTGNYTINFATALSDANYAAMRSFASNSGGNAWAFGDILSKTTSALQFQTGYVSSTGGALTVFDIPYVDVAIFGN